MRVYIMVVCLAGCVSALEVVSPSGYHEDVGIPLAARIKEREDKMMAERLAFKNQRIIGGVLAPANVHPHFAGLLVDLPTRQSVCGASLLSPNRLVTAAHCWYDGRYQAWRFTVILGSQNLYWDGTRIETSTVFMHPQWTPSNLINDVAMIYLPSSVWFTSAIQPIQLPTGNEQFQTFEGQWANAVGFGRTSDQQAAASTILSHVNLQVISEAHCRASYGSQWIFSSTLCTSGAGGVGVCGGDSGGPLAMRRPNGQNVLIGISSFAAEGMCERGFPSGFARVTSFMNFINQHLW